MGVLQDCWVAPLHEEQHFLLLQNQTTSEYCIICHITISVRKFVNFQYFKNMMVEDMRGWLFNGTSAVLFNENLNITDASFQCQQEQRQETET